MPAAAGFQAELVGCDGSSAQQWKVGGDGTLYLTGADGGARLCLDSGFTQPTAAGMEVALCVPSKATQKWKYNGTTKNIVQNGQ